VRDKCRHLAQAWLTLFPLSTQASDARRHFVLFDTARPLSTSDRRKRTLRLVAGAVAGPASTNVLLEVGIALGAGKQVLIIGGGSESLPKDLRSLPYIPTSGDNEADIGTVLRRLDSLQIEEESPRAVYHTVADRLRTYIDDPAYFESMSPIEFEELIIQWFQENGFSPSRAETAHEFGIDLVAQSPIDQSTLVIEAKKFNRQSRVSMRDVMALLGAATLFKASTGVLITSSSFTRAALEMAAESRNPRLRLLTMEEILHSQNLVELVRREPGAPVGDGDERGR
jgi:hypothetical protein